MEGGNTYRFRNNFGAHKNKTSIYSLSVTSWGVSEHGCRPYPGSVVLESSVITCFIGAGLATNGWFHNMFNNHWLLTRVVGCCFSQHFTFQPPMNISYSLV